MLDELKALTFRSRREELPLGLEHRIVSKLDGTRWLVRGGQCGIDLSGFSDYRRLLVHTHGSLTGPSEADQRFLLANGQWSSYLVEIGNPTVVKFSRPPLIK